MLMGCRKRRVYNEDTERFTGKHDFCFPISVRFPGTDLRVVKHRVSKAVRCLDKQEAAA